MIKIVYRLAGGHYHCRVFFRKGGNETFAKCGDLVVRIEEWHDFQRCIEAMWEEGQ